MTYAILCSLSVWATELFLSQASSSYLECYILGKTGCVRHCNDYTEPCESVPAVVDYVFANMIRSVFICFYLSAAGDIPGL